MIDLLEQKKPVFGVYCAEQSAADAAADRRRPTRS